MLRRFDIFAIYNYCKNLNKGMSEEKAKGDAIWVAKVVASGGSRSAQTVFKPSAEQKQAAHLNKVACQCDAQKKVEAPAADPVASTLKILNGGWKELSGIPQTDKLYDREIIKKIGKDRYEKQVLPAVRAAVDAKQKYVDIRDTLRAELDKQEVK